MTLLCSGLMISTTSEMYTLINYLYHTRRLISIMLLLYIVEMKKIYLAHTFENYNIILKLIYTLLGY